MIKEIQDNPFRILGVFSNSATKDIVANEGKMKAFLKVGRAVSYPLDLPSILPSVERNEAIVATAKSQIALPDDKVKNAQFWFIKSTPIDDIAFNHLFKGDFDGAVETFKKKVTASSLQNLVVCYLIKGNYQDALLTAVSLYSQFSTEFVNAIDQQSSLDKKTLISQFVDCLLASGVDLSSIKSSLTDSDWLGIINRRTSKPIVDNLKKALETARASRGKGSNARLNAGKKLMAAVKTNLHKLKGVLDTLQYQVLADELANEILQCGIDYFNDSDDDDAPHKALPIQKYAGTIAVGSVTKDRCKENLDILQKIIASLPPKEVAAEAKAINQELEKFCKLPDKISHSVTLLNAAKPHLQAIKNKLGASNSFYLKISTQVVGNALHNVIEEVNAAMERVERSARTKYVSSGTPDLLTLLSLKDTLQSAWDATKIMDSFDLETAFKTRYNTNRASLKNLCEQVGISTSTYSSPARSTSTRRTSTTTSRSAAAYSSSSSSRTSGSKTSSSTKDNSGAWIAFWVITIICAFWGAFGDGHGFDFVGFLAGGALGALIPGNIVRAIFSK